jgi:hypothetical protein
LAALLAGFLPGLVLAEPIRAGAPAEVRLVWWGSSSTGKLFAYMQRTLPDQLRMHRAPSSVWVRIDHISKDIEAGETAKYEGVLRAIEKDINRSRYDFGVLQVSGGVLWSERSTKHAARIVDDILALIESSGAQPVIFEHWTSRDPNRMRQVYLEAARKHRARVGFCGSASAEVIGERGKRYIGAGEGHTNARGLYLWSCCMYAALTGKSPVGLPLPPARIEMESSPQGPADEEPQEKPAKRRGKSTKPIVLTEEDAVYLQNKAWAVQQRYEKLLK